MDVHIYRPFIDMRSSRGFIKSDFNSATANGNTPVSPPVNYNLLDRMVRNDEVISTAFDTTVDMVTRNGQDFIPLSDDKTRNKSTLNKIKSKLFRLNWEEVQDNLIYCMLYYGDAFLELRRKKKGSKTSPVEELHMLETTEMRIVYDPHGEVTAYVQRPFSIAGLSKKDIFKKERESGVWFKPWEVIHYTMKKVGAKVYSETPLEPVSRLWTMKLAGHNYIEKLLWNLPPEVMVHLSKANKTQRDEFMSMLQRRKQNPGYIPVSYGDADSGIDVQTIPFDAGERILKVLEYARESVLMITRVPPVWVGLVNRDGANRGNSEAQVFSFETRIRKLQQRLNNKNSLELLPALGFDKWLYSYNPVTSKSEKEVIENIAVLHSLNVKPEALVKYAKRNGLTDFEPDDFEKPDLDMMGGFGGDNQTATNKTAPSRKGEDKRTDSMTNNRGRTGGSEAGAKKTDEKNKKQR